MRIKNSVEDKLYNYDSDHKVYCKCGKAGVVFKHKDTDRLICKNCRNYIYRDKKTELKYKMIEKGILKREILNKK